MDKIQRYESLMHAIQTGVATEMGLGSKDTTPKHLRVGINSGLVNQAGLVNLLVQKGIITEDEYFDAIITEAEAEVKRYEDRLFEKTGTTIHLG